jgi:hypothetical protein
MAIRYYALTIRIPQSPISSGENSYFQYGGNPTFHIRKNLPKIVVHATNFVVLSSESHKHGIA